MKKYKLTIAVAIYNLENYLEVFLNSLINQTVKYNIEILLINDGSIDKSLRICEKYIELGLKAKIITKKNGGLTSVRNLSIKESNAEYLWMVDGDDWIEANSIEKILEEISYKNDMLCFGFNWIYEKTVLRDERFLDNYIIQKEIVNQIFKDKINTAVWNKIFKVEIIRENKLKFLEIKGAEDYLFVYDYLKKSDSVKKISNSLYNYYQRDNGLSKLNNEEFYENNLFVLEELIKKVVEDKIESKDFLRYILNKYIHLFREYNKISKQKKIKEILQRKKNIEKYLRLNKILFLSKVSLKNKIRYMKVRIKNC
ncbi:MAG: glycosyltransferase family 2 protein [Cetobacterium sp.]